MHDEKPSDCWYHETSTCISLISDKLYFERFKKEDYNDVDFYVLGIRAKYTEAMTLHKFEFNAGVITEDELAKVKKWYADGIQMINPISNRFRMLHISDTMEITSVELEPKIKEFYGVLTALREHMRDNYLFEREIETRMVKENGRSSKS